MFKTILAGLIVCCSTVFAFAFDLQGHRGARGLLPENTLPAFAKALSIGVTTLELDTGITKDGVVVVSHDPALNLDITREKGGAWIREKKLIKELSLEELQHYDVGKIKIGSPTARRFRNQLGVDGTRIPTLAQVFELTKKAGNNTVRFNVETKINPLNESATVDPTSFAEAVLSVISNFGMEERVSIQSFDWRSLQAVQKINPSIETVYLTAQQNWLDNVSAKGGAASKWTAGFSLSDNGGSVPKLIKSAGGKVWSPFYRDLNSASIKEAHGLGLKVVPWTVNKPEDMAALIKMGVDGLISDYPDVLRNVMEKEGLPLPVATPVIP